MNRFLVLAFLVIGLGVGLWIDWNARWRKSVSARTGLFQAGSGASSFDSAGRGADGGARSLGQNPLGSNSTALAGGIHLAGLLTRTDGERLWVSETRVTALDEHAHEMHATISEEGDFAFPGLHAGLWWIAIDSAGCCAERVSLALPADELDRRLDVRLQPRERLRIRIVTADELSPTNAHAKLRSSELDFVATLSALSRFVPHEAFARRSGLVVSRAYQRLERESVADASDPAAGVAVAAASYSRSLTTTGLTHDVPPGCWGFLELERSLPLYVSAVRDAVVVHSQLVPRGAQEVTFVLSNEDLAPLAGSLKLRVLDARAKTPLTDAVVGIAMTRGEREREADERGDVTFDGLEAGWTRVWITADGYEKLSLPVCIRSSVQNDLGLVPLAQHTSIRGRVVDDAGRPATLSVTCQSLDHTVDGARFPECLEAKLETSGEFRFKAVGRGRQTLIVRDPRGVSRPLVIDTSEGPVEDVVLHAATPTRLVILLPTTVSADARLSIFDDARLPYLEVSTLGQERLSLPFPEGSWVVHLSDGEREVVTKRVDVTVEGLTLDLSR